MWNDWTLISIIYEKRFHFANNHQKTDDENPVGFFYFVFRYTLSLKLMVVFSFGKEVRR